LPQIRNTFLSPTIRPEDGGRMPLSRELRMRFAAAVAVALRATLRAANLHPHCASHREAATRFACANIQNSRRACGGSSLTIPCSSSHFVHTSGGNRSPLTQCMPHLLRSHRRQIRERTLLLADMSSCPITCTFSSADQPTFNSGHGSEC
jgi:hypothetical protein